MSREEERKKEGEREMGGERLALFCMSPAGKQAKLAQHVPTGASGQTNKAAAGVRLFVISLHLSDLSHLSFLMTSASADLGIA